MDGCRTYMLTLKIIFVYITLEKFSSYRTGRIRDYLLIFNLLVSSLNYALNETGGRIPIITKL